MATATSLVTSYDRSEPLPMSFPMSDNLNHGFFTSNSSTGAQQRIMHCLDDMDVLTLKRQYANFDLFDQSGLSNSAEDLSQIDRIPYSFQIFGQDSIDLDDDDLPYDENSVYEYTLAIQERLKRANEEFQNDQTSTELKHNPRVSFNTTVKAVDIILESNERDTSDLLSRSSRTSIQEEPIEIIHSPHSETSTYEYTLPLNDTQPKQGLSLLEKIKELQFQNPLINDEQRWATTANNDSINTNVNCPDDVSVTSCKSNENNLDNQQTSLSPSSKKTMIVAVNGRFDLQNEDDYTASTQKPMFIPTPPVQPKPKDTPTHRPTLVRPKSSTIEKKSSPTESTTKQRPKSASSSKSLETYIQKPSSGVDFAELLRQASEKKRAELREERRKKKQAEEKRQEELAKAKESYERWVQEKDNERKRIHEMKRHEQQEQTIRQAEEQKELDELREKNFQQWLERKNHELLLAHEFEKLKANEQANMESIPTNQRRAFQKWLRKKYLKSLEDKRQERVEAKHHRRRQRRSIKRNQLQKDLQLARTFGYS